MPPIVHENRCEEAFDFFLRLRREREELQQKLIAIHERQEKESRKMHSKELWEVGDRVWVRTLPWHEECHFDKLARILSGPYEILDIMYGGRYRVATSREPQRVVIGRLKLALPLLAGVKLKWDHHTLRPSPEHDDTWVLDDVVDFKEVPSTRGKARSRTGLSGGKDTKSEHGRPGTNLCTMYVTSGVPIMPNMVFRFQCHLVSLLATIGSLTFTTCHIR